MMLRNMVDIVSRASPGLRHVTILQGPKAYGAHVRPIRPDSREIRAAQKNIHTHLAYITFLAERRHWLAGEELSFADIAAAAHISCVDYLGDVPWADHPIAKTWYMRIKSRPSFRSLLSDRVPGQPPVLHYAELDF